MSANDNRDVLGRLPEAAGALFRLGYRTAEELSRNVKDAASRPSPAEALEWISRAKEAMRNRVCDLVDEFRLGRDEETLSAAHEMAIGGFEAFFLELVP